MPYNFVISLHIEYVKYIKTFEEKSFIYKKEKYKSVFIWQKYKKQKNS